MTHCGFKYIIPLIMVGCLTGLTAAEIAGPYASTAANTLQLWHLDQTVFPLTNSISGGPAFNYMGPGSSINQTSFTGFGKCYRGTIKGEASVSDGSWLAPYQAVNGTGDNTTMNYMGANGAFTYEAIIRIDFNPAVFPGAMEIIGAEEDSGHRLFQFGINASGLFFTALAPSSQMFAAAIPAGTDPDAIVQGNWYHAAVTYTGQAATPNNVKFYWTLLSSDRVEARCIGSGQLTSDLPAGKTPDFVIGNEGRDWNKRSEGFIGMIDEVRISSAARQAYQMLFYRPTQALRPMEKIDRGLLAVKVSNGVYLGWRMLGTDSSAISFNIYRDGSKINASPITASTNYVDAGGTLSSIYYVRPVLDGIELPATEMASVWPNFWFDLPLQRPAGGTTPDNVQYTYTPTDCSVGDLDGDGQYEIVLKWDPSNQKDNSQGGYTGNVYLDAYELNGTRLWRIDLGINIRAGAHYTQFMVYDLDSDGIAEVVCKTADGTTDAAGVVIGNPAADYRNSSGYILSGPEFLTVFNGRTGQAMATTNYVPARGSVTDWGDDYGNRVDRFLACVAYLDGARPSVVMCRGYYEKTVLAAWDWREGQLTLRWVFNSTDSGNSAYEGQGNHNLNVGDVDGDGRDEIVYGSCTFDDDGLGLYSTGLGHGDAMHLSDMDPSRPGLEVWQCHETSAAGATFRDARTGEVLIDHYNASDIGRCGAAHIDSRYVGYQLWSYAKGGTYTTGNVQISGNDPPQSFLVWWDGNLQREFLDGVDGDGVNAVINRWNGSDDVRLLSLYNIPDNYSSLCNGDRPCLSGDLLGDWREEIILRSSDNTKLRIFASTSSASNRFYSFMHDPQYRLAMAWQNTAYNQPPHPSFYVGAGMSTPPVPKIKPVEDTTKGLLREWWAPMAGSTVADLTNHPSYPNSPAGSGHLKRFEGPVDWSNSYGARIHGYLRPAQTGTYTFWIAGDNACELWLSTSDRPNSAVLTAQVTDWTELRQWDKYPAQQSAPVTLTAGQEYYIMALHKEASGDDHVSVAWQGPGISRQVIEGDYLVPYYSKGAYEGDPVVLPGTIQAEKFDFGGEGTAYHDATSGNSGGAFRLTEDVDIVSFVEGIVTGYAVEAADGEWLSFTVDSTPTQIEIRSRVASTLSGGQIKIWLDTQLLAVMDVPQTGSLTSWQLVSVPDVVLPGRTEAKLKVEFAGSFRLDWIQFTRQVPYKGGPSVVPGRIEFEDYDIGGQSVSYYDNNPGNSYNIYRWDDVEVKGITETEYAVYADPGEWLEYTANLQEGTYDIVVRSTSRYAAQPLEVMIDGELLTTLSLPKTDTWSAWQNTTASNLYIAGGEEKIVRLKLASSYSLLDWIEFVRHYALGDIDRSGRVDLEDFAILSTQWDEVPQSPSADIALPADGLVNLGDLMVLAENWLMMK